MVTPDRQWCHGFGIVSLKGLYKAVSFLSPALGKGGTLLTWIQLRKFYFNIYAAEFDSTY